MPGPPEVQPPSNEWLQLQKLGIRFERACQQAGSSESIDLDKFLPDPADPLRRPALRLLIRVDLEVRWQRGQIANLETYLTRFPELGPAAQLPPDLIFQEYRVRHLFGDKPAPESYQARFPDQYPQMLPLFQEHFTLSPPAGGTLDGPAPTILGIPPPTASAANLLPVVGGYRMVERLGEGTFGEVWKAEGPGGTQAAIKIITRPVDQKQAQQELQALEHVKLLRHPYLVQTQAYWILDERLYILMDLMDSSLTGREEECCAQGLPGIPLDELLRYMLEAAEALDYLHFQNVHHRDVKPGNILLQQGHARLADFGLARPLQAQASLLDATPSGTPAFMAPEVWERRISRHSDQWSLAATYAQFRLKYCTGDREKRLFKANDLVGLMIEICQGPPDLTGLEKPERQVLRKAMAMAPADRYPKCTAFAEALRDAMRPAGSGSSPTLDLDKEAAPDKPRDGGATEQTGKKPRLLPWAILLLAVLVPSGLLAAWFLAPPAPTNGGKPPRISLDNAPAVMVDTGREKAVALSAQRDDFTGPIRIACLAADLPRGVSIPPQEIAADGNKGTLQVAAAPDAVPGDYRVPLRAEGINADGAVGPAAQIVLQVTVLFLPAGFEKDADPIEDGKGVKYYQRIACVVEGMRVPFVLIPQRSKQERLKRKQDPDTFYIMQDKASLALFRAFARRQPAQSKDAKWNKKEANPLWPVLDVTVEEAYAFASTALKGNLPTVEQWDKASGRYEEPRPWEGPYKGKWKEGRKDIAINRTTPLPLDQAPGDESLPFQCRNMAGNGFEWTRTLKNGRLVPVRPLPKKGVDTFVHLRGRSFLEETPLTYEDVEQGRLPAGQYLETQKDLGFRAVVEP